MKRIAVSLLAVGLIAAPVLAAETAPAATAPAAPATKAADATRKKAPDSARVAPATSESKNLAMAKRPATHRRGHKRHSLTKPKAAHAPATK